jgi:hypothetical protein
MLMLMVMVMAMMRRRRRWELLKTNKQGSKGEDLEDVAAAVHATRSLSQLCLPTLSH